MSTRFTNGTNPVPGWNPSRVDQGVDGTLAGPYLAWHHGKVIFAEAHDPGWGGGGFVAVQVLGGRLDGCVIFVSEGVTPLVKVGQTVDKGQRIANRATNPYNGIWGNIETGFSNPKAPSQPLAQTLQGYAGDQSVAGITAGCAMNTLIGELGGRQGKNLSGHQPNWNLLPTQIRTGLGL